MPLKWSLISSRLLGGGRHLLSVTHLTWCLVARKRQGVSTQALKHNLSVKHKLSATHLTWKRQGAVSTQHFQSLAGQHHWLLQLIIDTIFQQTVELLVCQRDSYLQAKLQNQITKTQDLDTVFGKFCNTGNVYIRICHVYLLSPNFQQQIEFIGFIQDSKNSFGKSFGNLN